MSAEYLDRLEQDVIAAVRTLESERYYEFTPSLLELLRQCKHYQRITESVLGGHAGMNLQVNEKEFNRAYEERDWFRFRETTTEVALFVEEGAIEDDG